MPKAIHTVTIAIGGSPMTPRRRIGYHAAV